MISTIVRAFRFGRLLGAATLVPLAALLMLAELAPVNATQTVLVSGMVTGDGSPVPDAEVSVLTETGPIITRTDTTGAFRFLDIAPGAYPITVQADDFLFYENAIVVGADGVVGFVIELTPKEDTTFETAAR